MAHGRSGVERMIRGDVLDAIDVRAGETGQTRHEVALRHLLQLQCTPGVDPSTIAVWADAVGKLCGWRPDRA